MRVFILNKVGSVYEVVYDPKAQGLVLQHPNLALKSDVLDDLVARDSNYKTRAVILNAHSEKHEETLDAE